LPHGYEEGAHRTIGNYVPLSRYPDTYNGQPLLLTALASQKQAMSLYLMNAYADPELARWFAAEHAKRGRKLGMGKSCIRFKSVEALALDVIGKAIARTTVAKFVTLHENSRKSRRKSG
jgi:hypothetical protein